MILYDSPISGNCYKVRLLAAHLGLPLERRPLDVVDRSNRPEVIGDLNPALRVPTLVLDDGRPLGESGAILWYLGDGHALRARRTPTTRAQVLQWMFFEQYDHRAEHRGRALPAALRARSGAARRRLPALHEGGYKALGGVETRLGGSRLPRRRRG